MLCAVCRAAGDEDRQKREATIEHTYAAPLDRVTGWTRLSERVDRVVVESARRMLDPDAEGAAEIAAFMDGLTAPAPKAADDAKSFPLTDSGNAERFADQHRDKAQYVGAWKTWLTWDGRRWCSDERCAVDLLAKETARSIDAEVAIETDSDRRKALRQHAQRSESRSGRENMVALARAELAAAPDDFDRDPMLLNVANGTIDLRTGELRPHRREDMITRVIDIPFDRAAACPTFERFLDRAMAGNAALVTFLQKAIGYSLTGSVQEQVFFFCHGEGQNGKSKLAEVLLALLGPYGKAGAPDLLVSREHDQHPAEQADLEGARFVSCQEIEEGRSWNERTLKHLTGGDRIKARLMHQNWREFNPTHKLWVFANPKPKMREGGFATWRRVRLVPFDVIIPEAERDPMLGDKLAAELAGILRWAVEGCRRWQQEGLTAPPAVTNATAEYREQSDHVATFVEERLVIGEGHQAPKASVFEAYTLWCKYNREAPLSREAFSKRLQARGVSEKRTAGRRDWVGVGLADRTWPEC
jgi:putative DNA primase/helicase